MDGCWRASNPEIIGGTCAVGVDAGSTRLAEEAKRVVVLLEDHVRVGEGEPSVVVAKVDEIVGW